jgi:hypothetical protein
MRLLGKVGLSCLAIGLVTYMPVAQADYVSESEFAANGSIALTLETNLDNYLMPYEVQQIGNSVYNVGTNYGALGNEITSSTPQMDFVTKHITGYCSPNITTEAQAFSCNGQAGNLNGDTVSAQFLEMGDIRTSVLLEPLAYTQVIDLAARNFIRNITMPFPTQLYANYVTGQNFSTNAAQRKNYAIYMANQALLGVARYAMDEMYGMRTLGSNMQATGSAASSSIMTVMENEATRRFTDPNYAGNANSFLNNVNTTQQQVLVDMAAMQAFQLWLDYQSYRQNERIASLLAAILANNVSTTISQNANAIASGVSPQ